MYCICRQDFVTHVKNYQMLTSITMLITISSLLCKLNNFPRWSVYLEQQKESYGCGAVVENASLGQPKECWYPPLLVVFHLESFWSLAFLTILPIENQAVATFLIGIFCTSLGMVISFYPTILCKLTFSLNLAVD